MADKQWTLIGQTVTDHIKVPKTATHDNITRLLVKAENKWTSIAKIVNKYEIKNGTHDSVIQRIRDIKSHKITNLSQITGGGTGTGSSSGSSSSDGGNESGSDGGSTSTSGSSSGGSSTTSKVKITDPKEAMDFAKTEWNKIRRTSGHSLELQVFGSEKWAVGEWCKVYLPTFNEYTDMYITKVDHSNDSGSEWLTSLTLMDYAPQLSEPEETEEEEESSSNDGTDTTGEENGGQGNSNWTEVAKILQQYYDKPNGGWDNSIRAVLNAKVYDPDIKNVISAMKKKQGQEMKSYVDIGHELCNIVGITY